jgi:hypothetical protein
MALDSSSSPDTEPSELSPSASASQRPSSVSSQNPFSDHTTARKRVIYAHSDILSRRSDYFATMLASSFSENPGAAAGERTVFTVNVEEADFDTIYWLLKFCYANWLLFKENDDPRAAVDSVGSAKLLDNVQGGEWDWKTFRKGGTHDDSGTLDGRSVASRDSLPSERSKSPIASPHTVKTSGSQQSPSTPIRVPSGQVTASSRQPSQSIRRAPPQPSASSLVSSRPKTMPLAVSVQANFSPSSRYPVSPRQHRPPLSTPDPHPHPIPPPPPASALMIYQVAQRYGLSGLATLALEHIMTSLTPHTSFALLLATAPWDELKSLVEVRI